MSVASVLCENTDFDIILTGGLVRNRDRALTGEDTSEFIKKFKVNYAILGIGSITSEGNLLDYDYRDFHVSKTAISIAEKNLLLLIIPNLIVRLSYKRHIFQISMRSLQILNLNRN